MGDYDTRKRLENKAELDFSGYCVSAIAGG
jgi:hypothetical protein